MTADDLYAGRGFSADFTGEGWREHLGYQDAPLYSAWQAGERLAEQAGLYDFALFEFWPSDVAGHRQEMKQATTLLESFDQVLGGLFNAWQDEQGVILITSDHGNLEDLSTRRHTRNPVPCLVIGDVYKRRVFLDGLIDLSGIAPAIIKTINQTIGSR
jgi:bisphosphoglycerate-independent phosphoglycerate mutase (AlkP superfamily)